MRGTLAFSQSGPGELMSDWHRCANRQEELGRSQMEPESPPTWCGFASGAGNSESSTIGGYVIARCRGLELPAGNTRSTRTESNAWSIPPLSKRGLVLGLEQIGVYQPKQAEAGFIKQAIRQLRIDHAARQQ